MSELSIFVFPAASLVVGITLEIVNAKVRFLGIPDSVFQFVFAIFAAVATYSLLPMTLAEYITDNYTWTQIPPQSILVITLPPLLFEAAFRVNAHIFFNKLTFITTLTVVAYLGTIFISAAVLLPIFHITDNLHTLLFLSIIASTDPVAVVAILEQYGAPHRLRVLIEGESLLNDGAALMCYHMLVSFLKMETMRGFAVEPHMFVFETLMCVCASPVLGCLAAQLCAWLVSKIAGNPQRQLVIGVFVFGVFVFCDRVHGSSAVGLVFFGIMLNYCKEQMSPETCESALQLWQVAGYWANALIFMFAGYLVGSEMFKSDTHNWEGDYAHVRMNELFTFLQGVLISPVPFLARASSIYIFYHAYGFFASRPMPPPKNLIILSYAGLRGALGLILSMELMKEVRSPDCKKVMLLVCSTTVTCLIFQGMTFSAVAQKEGSTKRSRYVKDTCVRLSRFLSLKMRGEMTAYQKDDNPYLTGANWDVAECQVADCLARYGKEMEQEMADLDDSDLPFSYEEKMAAEVQEARVGLFGILLAKVHDSWETGALSGKCAHVTIALIEHGIDEGNITAEDIEDHLQMFEPTSLLLILSTGFRRLRKWLKRCGWLCNLAAVKNVPLFVGFNKNAKVQMTIPRTYEIWWIFHTVALTVFTVLLAYALFDLEQDEAQPFKKSGYVVWQILIFVTKTFETTFIIHDQCVRPKSLRRTLEMTAAIATMVLALVAFLLNVRILYGGHCIFQKSDECAILANVYMGCMVALCLYRITRATPILVIVVYEYCQMRKLSRDRLRLAVFYFLHHLMSDAATKISHDLFGDASYKIVKKEIRQFGKLLEGLMRLEFKENVEELDVVTVIKTRQAIRMMSYKLNKLLLSLRKEGFMPGEAEGRWTDVVKELRVNADAVQFVAQLEFKDWLLHTKWLQKLRESTRKNVVDILVQVMSRVEPVRLVAKEFIMTNGACCYFIKKGIVKIIEWVPLQAEFRSESYAGQGEFIGLRNLLFVEGPSERKKTVPLTFPRRRYETTTYTELVWIDGDTMKKMLQADQALYRVVSEYVQSTRLITEVGHVIKTHDLKEKFWEYFGRKGKTVTGRETIQVPDGKLAFVGCWTNIVALVPRVHMDRTMLYIRGPAMLVVEPADKRSMGYVYIDKVLFRDAFTYSNETSNISIMQDFDRKVLVRHGHVKKTAEKLDAAEGSPNDEKEKKTTAKKAVGSDELKHSASTQTRQTHRTTPTEPADVAVDVAADLHKTQSIEDDDLEAQTMTMTSEAATARRATRREEPPHASRAATRFSSSTETQRRL